MTGQEIIDIKTKILKYETTIYGLVIKTGNSLSLNLANGRFVALFCPNSQIFKTLKVRNVEVGLKGIATADLSLLNGFNHFIITSFEVLEILPYYPKPLTEIFAALRFLVGNDFGGMDVHTFIKETRHNEE